MSTPTLTAMGGAHAAETASFERIGGICAFLTGVGGLLYAISFVIISRSNPALGGLLSAVFLMLNGLFGTAALAALYGRVRATNETAALWAFFIGSIAALGAAIHGGYDLANAINPPAALNADLPSPIDPRGLLTFGVMGLAIHTFSWLVARTPNMSKGLAYLGYLLAVLLIVIYLARLVILSPASPLLLVPVLVSGFLVNPAWYIWLGAALWRNRG